MDMPILDLNNLCVGDVILEPGEEKIADMDPSGNHGFGLAKLVVCRLAFIHAPGAGKAVRIEPFAVETWTRCGEPPLVGVRLEGATVLRKRRLVAVDVQVNAQWEAGYGYASQTKLEQLPLTSDMQDLLRSPRATTFFALQARRGVPTSDEGRSCGELVAQILLPGESADITPNGLYRHPEMEERSDLVLDDTGWTRQGRHPCNDDLEQLFADYRQDTARRLWEKLVRFTATRPGEDAMEAESTRLETELDDSLKSNFSIFNEADAIASQVLPN